MEIFLIIALLASNLWLIRKVLTKPEIPTVKDDGGVKENTEQPEAASTDAQQQEIVGKSNFDVREFMTSFREIAKDAASEAIKEAVPLIVKEIGTPADAGLPEAPEVQIPKERLDEVFSNLSASELTGETPPPAEADADGVNFEELQAAMKVLKDKPHTAEDEQIARRVIPELEGTEIIEYVKLDPVVRKRILMIECRLPEIPEENVADEAPLSNPEETKPKKKIVFHADIDTTDIDALDFNILH